MEKKLTHYRKCLNCIGYPPPDTLSRGEISLQTCCLAVGAFDICVTADGLFAAGRYPYD
jgi:hypothetical protein